MAATNTASPSAPPERRHGLWIFSIWFVLAVVVDTITWTVWYPHFPPGRMSNQARGQQFDIGVMAMLCFPVLLFVWTYFAYALITWHHRKGDDTDGPAIFGTAGIQATWIAITSVIVLFLAGFGTYELIVPQGAGGGEGPSPIWNPSGVTTASAQNLNPPAWTPGTKNQLVIQVIGQQWKFTYRYPQFGGMESSQLLMPVNAPITFHVTSLDVIHSFWAYQLGVKIDANPGVDNIGYVTPQHTGSVTVRCNELCGIWHGAMFDYGHVVSASAFQSWASGMQAKEQANGVLTELPKMAWTYDPTVLPQLGQAIVKVDGITGANGYYYPSESQAGVPGDPVSP